MTLILHLITQKEWEHAKSLGILKGESSHGPGHVDCWYPSQLEKLANTKYKGHKDLVLLYIESNRVHAKVHEEGKGDQSHPRIFGPLNLDSVSKVVDLMPDALGKFSLPKTL